MTAAAVARHVRRARSHFYLAMRLMPARQRRAMFAIYAFARALDDVVDGTAPDEEKRRALDGWRAELARIYDGEPETQIGRALAAAVDAYGLPREEFEELIRGMEMDIAGGMKAPPLATLDTYCRRVAGTIGMLSLRVFRCDGPSERDFAAALGAALQMTNIARDIEEDGARDRLYVPREILDAVGADNVEPRRVGMDPRLTQMRRQVCDLARTRFARAEVVLAGCRSRRRLWPALAMMAIYRRMLTSVAAAPQGARRVRIPLHIQLGLALRAMLLARP